MRKITILIAILGATTFLGVVLTKTLSGTDSNRASSILGSLSGNKIHKATLSIDGMWCTSCAVAAGYNLKAIEGVADAYIGFTDKLDGEGWAIYESDKVSSEQIIKAIQPYEATIVSDTVYTETR